MKTIKTKLSVPKYIEREELSSIGWLQITSVGSENMYFDYINELGHVSKGYHKILS